MKTILLFLLSFLSASFAMAAQIEWDAVSGVTITNYSVYVGPASGSYTGKVQVGTALLYRITNAPGTVTWYRVTATSGAGVESDPSNEVAFTNRNFAPNIRLNLQGAGTLNGQSWTNLVQLEAYVPTTDAQAFYRAQVEWIR